MKRLLVISLTLSLILLTALIKNSTKRIDDEIFVFEESIRILKKDFENVKLEHDYLSSSEKLLKLQSQYFDSELIQKDIQEIKVINKISGQLEIEQLKLINE